MKFENMFVEISKLLCTPLSKMFSNTWICLVLEISGDIYDSFFILILYTQFSIESLILTIFHFSLNFKKSIIFANFRYIKILFYQGHSNPKFQGPLYCLSYLYRGNIFPCPFYQCLHKAPKKQRRDGTFISEEWFFKTNISLKI